MAESLQTWVFALFWTCVCRGLRVNKHLRDTYSNRWPWRATRYAVWAFGGMDLAVCSLEQIFVGHHDAPVYGF